VATVLLALLAVAAVAVAAAVAPGTPQARAAEDVVLTVTGNGQSKDFTMADIKALPQYTGYFGFVNSAGTVFPPEPVKGVKMSDVLAQVGGMTTLNSCDIVGSDGYPMTFTYDQLLNGADVQMYNATTKAKEAPKAPFSFVLIYEQNGQPLPTTGDDATGPLRVVVAQEQDVNQVADGHLMVKLVALVKIRGAVQEWKVKMYGLKGKNGRRQTYTLDRTSYDSCSAPGCHGESWVNPADDKTWSGVPLFLCLGKVDGGKGHDSYAAYNDALALRGYRVKLVSSTGKYVIVGSRTVRNRVDILLASKFMTGELAEKWAPLRLVGPTKRIPSGKWLGRISKIYLLPK
jgi:DMSO/TMAO reductase YedYZ molybdopterin-dependent catalytic subunit